MNCAWLKDRLPRPEVELWRNGRPSSALLEHARGCAECGQMIEHEARLKVLLLGMAETTRQVQPSPEVHARLLGELELRSKATGPSHRFFLPVRLRWGLAAVAAVVLSALAVITSLREERVGEPPDTVEVQQPAQKPANAAQPPKETKPVQAAKTRLKKPAGKTERRPSATLSAAADEHPFYPLMMCDPYTCDGDAIEVQMRVTTPSMWLTGGSQRRQGVNARVLVGEDGMVRAIKFEQ